MPTSLRLSRRKFTCAFVSMFAATTLASSPVLAGAVSAPHVLLKTNLCEIVLELNPEKAPKTVKNFLGYENRGIITVRFSIV